MPLIVFLIFPLYKVVCLLVPIKTLNFFSFQGAFGHGNKIRNVTRKIWSLISNNRLDFSITNEVFVNGQDPDPGHVKDFYLEYIINNQRIHIHKKEYETVKIPEEELDSSNIGD